MISRLTKKQFFSLPQMSYRYPCDKCSTTDMGWGSILRDVADCSLVDGKIVSKKLYTALYLCSGCHWTMTCEYLSLERKEKQANVRTP